MLNYYKDSKFSFLQFGSKSKRARKKSVLGDSNCGRSTHSGPYLWRPVEGIGVEDGLDHDEGLG